MFSLADATFATHRALSSPARVSGAFYTKFGGVYRRSWTAANGRCNRDEFFRLIHPPQGRHARTRNTRSRSFSQTRFHCSALHGSVMLCAVTNARSMTSNAIRGIRRKKSSLCEVKVAVIGAPGVGKSGGYNTPCLAS